MDSFASIAGGCFTCITYISEKRIRSVFYILSVADKKLSTGISDLFHSVYAYSLTTLRWLKQSLPFSFIRSARLYHTAKSGIMVFGGDTGETFHQVELAMAAIHAENDPVVKQN